MQFIIENGVFRNLIAPYFTRTVEIPEEVTAIGAHAFEGFGLLEQVTLPPHLTEIGAHAFRGCGNLMRLSVDPKIYDGFHLPEGLTSIGDEAFMRCHKMDMLVLPSTLTDVRSRALRDCDGLKDVYLRTEEGTYRFGIGRISPFGMWRSDWVAEILTGDFSHAETPEELLLITHLHALGLFGRKPEAWLLAHAEYFFHMLGEHSLMLAALYLNGDLKPLLHSHWIASEIPPDILELLVQDANKRKDYETQMQLSEIGQKYDSLEQLQKYFHL